MSKKKYTVPDVLVQPRENGINIIYTLQEVLGEGGFAKVYHVVNQRTKEDLALKVVQKETLENEEFKAKHFAEIAIQSSFDHPNIVKCIANWKDDNNTYIVMELCQRGSLKNALARRGLYSEPECAKVMRDIIAGVANLHDNHVIHRDLKLDNFLIGDDGTLKITDFGISERLTEDKEKELVFAGTPTYMGPEVVGLKNYGYQVDIWAIGVCAFELLTGHTPFEGSSMKMIYDKIKKGEFRFPNGIKLSFVAKDFIQSALQVKPELRPNIHELAKHPFLNLADKVQDSDLVTPAPGVTMPSFSVSRFCDKTSKFGFGYLLLDGTIGVCFNDFTRMILDPFEDFIQCWPTYSDPEPIIIPIKDADLQQKHISFLMKFAKTLKANPSMFVLPQQKPSPEVPLRHVKYWLRDPHNILFRLDNRVVQVNFEDKTKVMVFFSQKKMLMTKTLQGEVEEIDIAAIEVNEEAKKRYAVVRQLLNDLSHSNA